MSQVRPLNPELKKIACEQLNENETNISADLEALRSWLEQQPHLRARTDDQVLLAFLRFCKHDLESTKTRIDYFYTFKSTEKKLLRSCHLDDKVLEIAQSKKIELQKIIFKSILYTLKNPAGAGGPRIHVTLMGNINPSIHTVAQIFRYHVMRCEIEMNTDDNWNIAGVIEIIDFSKIPFGFLRQFDLGVFKKMSAFLEYGIPTDLRGTHIVNASKEVQIILSLIRNVMKNKELLFIHPNLESLQQAIGQEYLPSEYGGLNGSLQEADEDYNKLLSSFKTYFDEDENYGVDEKLRQQKTNVCSTSSLLRKLNID